MTEQEKITPVRYNYEVTYRKSMIKITVPDDKKINWRVVRDNIETALCLLGFALSVALLDLAVNL